jgi:hypothetical protein
MNKLNRFRSVFFTALLIALTVVAVSPIPAVASTGITISGAVLVAEVIPGETLTHKITITLGTSEIPTDATLQVSRIGQAADGTFILQGNTVENNRFSARDYISLDKNTTHLIPGVPQDIMATIRVPEDVGEGGKYAVINIQTQPAGNGNIGVISAINIPVYLTVKSTELIHQGNIASISTGEITSGKPIDIITTFQNTGNHHFKIKSEVTITDASDEILDIIFTDVTPTSLIPEMQRESRVIFIPGKELLPGVYTVNAKIIAEDGTFLDEATANFEVKTPLLPPPAPATQTLIPTKSGLLQTTDGIISINFPKGAVTAAVDVTLRDYPLSQLPPLPPEYQLSTICFRVDGISGLLVEKAMITVKFTAADLEKAEGNASRLKLAYWDEASGKWAVLKTSADQSVMTVTTTTNHFSVWTVMVGPAKSNILTSIAGALATCIFAVFGGLLLLTRKRR